MFSLETFFAIKIIRIEHDQPRLSDFSGHSPCLVFRILRVFLTLNLIALWFLILIFNPDIELSLSLHISVIHFFEKVIFLWWNFFRFFLDCFLSLGWAVSASHCALFCDAYLLLKDYWLRHWWRGVVALRGVVMNHRLLDGWVNNLLALGFDILCLLLKFLNVSFWLEWLFTLLLKRFWLKLME